MFKFRVIAWMLRNKPKLFLQSVKTRNGENASLAHWSGHPLPPLPSPHRPLLAWGLLSLISPRHGGKEGGSWAQGGAQGLPLEGDTVRCVTLASCFASLGFSVRLHGRAEPQGGTQSAPPRWYRAGSNPAMDPEEWAGTLPPGPARKSSRFPRVRVPILRASRGARGEDRAPGSPASPPQRGALQPAPQAARGSPAALVQRCTRTRASAPLADAHWPAPTPRAASQPIAAGGGAAGWAGCSEPLRPNAVRAPPRHR